MTGTGSTQILGIFLSVGSYFSLKVSYPVSWKEVHRWYRDDRWSFIRNILYLRIYPGFVEELLFRWFFYGCSVDKLWLGNRHTRPRAEYYMASSSLENVPE